VQNSQGERLQIYPPTTTGGFNTGALQDLRLTVDVNPPEASTLVEMAVNLPANATPPAGTPFDPADSDTFNHSTSTLVYDSLGVAHTATYYFVNSAPNTWEVAQTIDGTQVGGLEPITFAANGSLATPASGNVTFGSYTPPNGASPLTADLDVLQTTQYGESFVVNSIDPDGRAAGRLVNVEIDQSGVIFARYSNG